MRAPTLLLICILTWLTSFQCLADSTSEATVKTKIRSGNDKGLVIDEMRSEIQRLEGELDAYRQESYKLHLEYTKKYYSYLGQKADINIEQFNWQRRASERLMWLVILVVFSGVVFSGVQLWRAANIKDLGGESTIEIEARKIKITTSVVGVVVLAISIIFFYFFLIEVYRVKIVDLSKSEVAPNSIGIDSNSAQQSIPRDAPQAARP